MKRLHIFIIMSILICFVENKNMYGAEINSAYIIISPECITFIKENRPVTIDLKDGERIIGIIERIDDNNISIVSNIIGLLRVSVDQVHRISPYDLGNIILYPDKIKGKGIGNDCSVLSETKTPANEKISQAPEKAFPLFLKDSSVLILPRMMDVDLSLSYKTSVVRSYNVLLGEERERKRWLIGEFAARIGVFKNTEITLNVPLAYIYYNHVSTGDPPPKDAATDYGLGDISGGIKYNFNNETEKWPSLTGFVNVSAPTGSSPYQEGITAGGIGSGHWRLSGGLAFVKSYDPVIFFGGLSYGYYLSRNTDYYKVKPGWIAEYFWGLGFSINDKVNTSWQIQGAYQEETSYDGNRRSGTDSEPILLRWGTSFALASHHFLEAFVTYGLNDDSHDVSLGIIYTTRFDFRKYLQ